jgi:CMP-N,N'-diacetyllegionaminic acid synthase
VHDEILAVVPARAGSKGIPRKNLAHVAGCTLIARACRIGASCPSVAVVVISSDDEEMGEEGLRNGADHFVRRPSELSTDTATAADVWLHAWQEAESRVGREFGVSILLQPTSPTRTVNDVEATVATLRETDAGACLTVSPVPMHFAPEKLLRISSDGSVTPAVQGAVPNQRRQAIKPAYWLNGHCYAIRRYPFHEDRVVVPYGARAVVIRRLVANVDEPQDLTKAAELLANEAG